MNNFSKASSEVYSTMKNLESMLEDERILKLDMPAAYRYRRELEHMNKWLKETEGVYTQIENFVDMCSYEADMAERARLNILDIKSEDSDVETRKKHLINSIRRMGTKFTIRNPLAELKITSHSGYYRIIQVMSNNSIIIEITVTYPLSPVAVLDFSTSPNNHSSAERAHQVHADVDRYLVELVTEADIVGRPRDEHLYRILDDILSKVVETISMA